MVAELRSFFGDLSLDKLRLVRPSKFMFLCGGVIVKTASSKTKAENLRDYIHRVRPLRLSHPTVLAEDAVQLFRDSHYDDLISFEEDLARIAAIVLVIAESAGSLAELGAFATNETICNVLRVIIRHDHDQNESFIRYGPVERVRKAKRENIGVYPWRTRAGDGHLILSSIKPHYSDLKKFIAGHLNNAPKTSLYSKLEDSRIFYIIYWVIFLCQAITRTTLLHYVQLIDSTVTLSELSRKLYCMLLANWIAKTSYSDKDYFYARFDTDAFAYKFKPGTADNEPIRRKLQVYNAHRESEDLPPYIRNLAASARKEPKP